MKKPTIYIILLSLILFSPAPYISLAETNDESSDPLYNDGSNDSMDDRRERFREYRRESTEIRNRINELDNNADLSLQVPILFGVGIKDIYSDFGDPRSNNRLHEGQDMLVVKGTPIISPTPAVVLRTGEGSSSGIYVYTANPGGETYVYYHLDRIGEGVVRGAVLSPGSLIGYVGNTGNAINGPAHLHFEIHDSSRDPIDPFPRLIEEFSLEEKITFTSKILEKNLDPINFAKFLVSNFRATFIAALAQNIDLPIEITNALADLPVPANGDWGLIPPGDLDIGSGGPLVVSLQQYLIKESTGSAATRLASAGATGYFGPITQAALKEFQIAVGISPASGYYGSITREYIDTHPLGVSPTTNGTFEEVITSFTRNLYLGISGEDVRALQRLLNANGFIIASSGPGSPGNETTYYGSLTQAAVIRFQVSRGINPAIGYFGQITRTAIATI